MSLRRDLGQWQWWHGDYPELPPTPKHGLHPELCAVCLGPVLEIETQVRENDSLTVMHLRCLPKEAA